MGMRVMDIPQIVGIPNNYNTRHLGGYRAGNGKIVRAGRVIRSGKPVGFKEEDIQLLSDSYGLKYVVDLRTEGEAKDFPSLTNVPGIQYLNWSMFDEEDKESSKKLESAGSSRGISQNELIKFYRELGSTPQGVRNFYSDVYVTLTQTERSQKVIRDFFELLLSQREGDSVLFHCKGGKDRTGILAFFFLYALGVSWDDCMHDYMLSNTMTQEDIDNEIDAVKKLTDDPDVHEGCRLIMSVEPDYLNAALQKITQQHGTLDEYMRKVLLLDGKKRRELQELYTA